MQWQRDEAAAAVRSTCSIVRSWDPWIVAGQLLAHRGRLVSSHLRPFQTRACSVETDLMGIGVNEAHSIPTWLTKDSILSNLHDLIYYF
jgi:hypothetical protein